MTIPKALLHISLSFIRVKSNELVLYFFFLVRRFTDSLL